MLRLNRLPFVLVLLLAVAACVPALPDDSGLSLVTAYPTMDDMDSNALCAGVDANWGMNWDRTIELLRSLTKHDAVCADGQASAGKLYVAHYNYGLALVEAGDTAGAVAQYAQARLVAPERIEAQQALLALGVFTPEPPQTCDDDIVKAAHSAVSRYEPILTDDFVTVDGYFLTAQQGLLPINGVNFYPMQYPWKRFIPGAPLDAVAAEFDMIADAGFNTLRIFLWHEPLFQCAGNGAVPVPEVFARLDAMIGMAAERGLRLIVTLNDAPDLVIYPLYSSPEHTVVQMQYIVERYRDEAAILAWDVRNEADIDYQAVGSTGGGFERDAVLAWLAETTAAVREVDPNHLVTAGWFRDADATIPFVDFVSFHHWGNALDLGVRAASIRSHTDKPIVLEEFGYSTFIMDEVRQSQLLQEAIQTSDSAGLAGWLIWSAFDFPLDVTCTPPACPSLDNHEHHFGLWTTDYEPKIGLGLVRIAMYEGLHEGIVE